MHRELFDTGTRRRKAKILVAAEYLLQEEAC